MKKFFMEPGLFMVLAGTFALSIPAAADSVVVKKGTQIASSIRR